MWNKRPPELLSLRLWDFILDSCGAGHLVLIMQGDRGWTIRGELLPAFMCFFHCLAPVRKSHVEI